MPQSDSFKKKRKAREKRNGLNASYLTQFPFLFPRFHIHSMSVFVLEIKDDRKFTKSDNR